MKKAKKKRAGVAEVLQLLIGDFKTTSSVLSVTDAVCYSTDKTNQLKEAINSSGLKNGSSIVKLFPI